MPFNQINTNNIKPNNYGLDWSQISIQIPGLIPQVIGCVSINYEENMEMQNNFGIGQYPVSRGQGNVNATATIEMYAEEIVVLEKLAVFKKVQNLAEFDVVVQYTNTSGAITKDIIKNCRWTQNSRNTKQNDMNIIVSINLNPTHIEFDA